MSVIMTDLQVGHLLRGLACTLTWPDIFPYGVPLKGSTQRLVQAAKVSGGDAGGPRFSSDGNKLIFRTSGRVNLGGILVLANASLSLPLSAHTRGFNSVLECGSACHLVGTWHCPVNL